MRLLPRYKRFYSNNGIKEIGYSEANVFSNNKTNYM